MFDVKVILVSEGVWCIRRPSYFSCSYIIQNHDHSLVLVDTGMDSHARDTCYALKKIGLDVHKIIGILVTHWHLDHSAGLFYLQEKTGCQIYMHSLDYDLMAQRESFLCKLIPNWGPLILLKGHLPNHVRRPDLILPVQDGGKIFSRFTAVTTPGHTPGHVAFLDHHSRSLFCGDALAVNQQSLKRMARLVTPDQKEALASMHKLMALDFDYLCPGHRYPLAVNEIQKRVFRDSLSQQTWPFYG